MNAIIFNSPFFSLIVKSILLQIKLKYKLNFFTILLLLLSFISVAQAQNENRKELPDLELKTLNDKVTKLKEHIKEGEISYIIFWSTSCLPCKKQLNNLADIYLDLKEKYKLNVIAININDSKSLTDIKKMVEGNSWEYNFLYDPDNASYKAFDFNMVPMSLLIDKKSKVALTQSHYKEGDEDIIIEEIKNLLKE